MAPITTKPPTAIATGDLPRLLRWWSTSPVLGPGGFFILVAASLISLSLSITFSLLIVLLTGVGGEVFHPPYRRLKLGKPLTSPNKAARLNSDLTRGGHGRGLTVFLDLVFNAVQRWINTRVRIPAVFIGPIYFIFLNKKSFFDSIITT
ncbi:hypothetical protein KSP40_PGU013153 [Platanthera guangdongensis]|uniref:Uncharacterized protein n=1 Tax=Platanthera guangdongensis TaxID=2320717 RepID=A0ABR2MQK1_9ASPA